MLITNIKLGANAAATVQAHNNTEPRITSSLELYLSDKSPAMGSVIGKVHELYIITVTIYETSNW